MMTRIRSRLGFMSISVNKFDTNLFGQSKRNLLAIGSAQLSLAFLDRLGGIHDFRDGDAFFLFEIFTAHAGQRDGLRDAGLDGLGVGNLNGNIDIADNRHVVLSFLLDFLAVFAVASIASVTSMAVSLVPGLADGDHLDIGAPFERNLNSLSGGVFVLFLVRIRANILRDFFDRLSANSSGDSVAEFHVDNLLDG